MNNMLLHVIIKESPICKLNQGKSHAMISKDMLSSLVTSMQALVSLFSFLLSFFPLIPLCTKRIAYYMLYV